MTERTQYQVELLAVVLMGLLFWSAIGWAAMLVLA
jgi:hypothetical protein